MSSMMNRLIEKAFRWWLRRRTRDSGLTAHARRELDNPRPGSDEDVMVVDTIRFFSLYGHSGGSAAVSIAWLRKLLNYEPLGPLTGEDSEWNDVSEYHEPGTSMWQNNRCSHVFKGPDGAYDINGKVFVEPDGSSFTSTDSNVPITFPYTPTTEYVQVPQQRDGDE